MTGQQQCVQEKLFYMFNLEYHVPEDHLLRGIDRCLDRRDLRLHLADYYSYTDHPSINPELCTDVGYCYGIRSEGRLRHREPTHALRPLSNNPPAKPVAFRRWPPKGPNRDGRIAHGSSANTFASSTTEVPLRSA